MRHVAVKFTTAINKNTMYGYIRVLHNPHHRSVFSELIPYHMVAVDHPGHKTVPDFLVPDFLYRSLKK